MGALESLLAAQSAEPTPQPKQGGALEKLLASGGAPAEAPTAPKPVARGGSSNVLVDDLVGGTADAIDLVWTGLFAAPVAMAGEAVTRATLGANNLLGIGEPTSRRDIGRAGQATAARLNESLGTPVRSTLKALGLLSDRPMAVEKAMQAAMGLVERDAASVEERTGGRIQKEDVLMGVNALFGALGAKGVQYVAKTVPERARAKDALKELAALREEGDVRNAAADAEELNRAAGGIPKAPLARDNPAAMDANLDAFDRRVNAEKQAHKLMQEGAPSRKVEAVIKQNPAVGAALETMMARRQQAATFLQEAPVNPIREDGSFAPNSLTSMLHRPSEMGPAEFAARDQAAGIQRGPLGEPILAADPALPKAGRSSRDPARKPLFGPDIPLGTKRGPLGEPIENPPKRDYMGVPLSPSQTLALAGATGLGLAAYYAGDADASDVAAAATGGALLLGKGRGISLEAIRALPDTATLREIRDVSAYTLNTLENLPGNRAVHNKQAVSELLRRQEVTKAERDILQGVLDSVPGETITAKQLMAGVKETTGDFELKPRASEKYADYGLENIDRGDPFDGSDFTAAGAEIRQDPRNPDRYKIVDGDSGDLIEYVPHNGRTPEQALAAWREMRERPAADATTTIYQSPFELGTNNHFNDPNYFAHTRSFYENGVKHVVEMQSDLAQKAGKVLTAEERTKLQATLDADVAHFTDLRRVGPASKKAEILAWIDSLTSEQFDAFNRKHGVQLGDRVIEATQRTREDLQALNQNDLRAMLHNYKNDRINPIALRMAEVKAKLAESGNLGPIAPMLKRWDRRLVREELADSVRGRVNPEYAAAREAIKDKMRQLKVAEGPGYENAPDAEWLRRRIEADGEALLALPERLPPEPVVRFATADTVAKVEGWPERGAGADEAGGDIPESANAPRFSPEHQGIYDRYNKEVTTFLRQLGGKEVTDSAGHTWIEVPTEGTKKMPGGKRVQQFGAADPELVKTLGAVGGGVAVASLLSDDENKARNMALAAVGVSLAMFGRSHVTGLGEMATAAVAGAEKYLGTVSTRVGNMSPRLLRRMREHERGVLTRTNAYLQAIGPFVEGLRKVPEALRAELDAAILTGDPTKITRALGRTGKPELVGQFRQARALLDKVGAELMQAGKLKGLLADYYPRIVTDAPGLLKALGAEQRTFIEKKIAEASRKTAKEALRDLTPFEVSQIINKALKGAPQGNGRPGFLKGRVIDEVTPELAKFYAPASESLPLYLRAVSKELERARFFGENLLRDPVSGVANLDESIGNLVREEQLAGRITSEQAVELGDILRSRFGPGERTTSRPLQAVKNLAYAGLLGHVTSAITQLGDVAIAAVAHGILPTIKAIQQNVTRQKARATVHDLGMIDHMAEEIVSASRSPVTVYGRQVSTAKFLEKAFKYSGFSWVDSVGKNVSIQASKNKLERWAKTPAGIKRLEAKYGKAYTPREMQQLVADLRSGELTDLVKGVMFSELSDVQPISKLEVPQGYLDNPNGRVLYMLKTFMLKQADIVRREVVQEFRRGNYRKGTEQALRFGLALGIGGASTQWINNWLLGRDKEPEALDIPLNALKTFGWSQYTLDKIKQGKSLEAVADVAAPPYKMFDTIVSQDPAALQYLPIVGRIYYARDWFDLLDESGSSKANRKLEREERRKEREE